MAGNDEIAVLGNAFNRMRRRLEKAMAPLRRVSGTTMGHDVFISHCHADKAYADAICHKLESSNIRCWIAPRDIHPSEDWAEAIINAMDNSQVLLLLFSSSSNVSPQVRREVERAVNKGLIILPFRIEDVPLSKSLEYFISSQHWLDAITGDTQKHLADLCDVVARLLNSQPSLDLDFCTPSVARKQELEPELEPIPRAEAVRQISPAILGSVEVLLAKVLGPIAKHLVKSKITADMTPEELVSALSQEIDDEREREQFVARCATVI